MSYDYLRNYSIPTISANNGNDTSKINHWESEQSKINIYGDPNAGFPQYLQTPSLTEPVAYTEYSHPDRFIPAGGKHEPTWRPLKHRTQKRKFSQICAIPETTEDGKLAIFQGRDSSYPDALNALIHPISCELCQTQLNSLHSAKDHYESKVHDRSITNWLTKVYTDKGIEPPPVKRFVKEGTTGPDAYHCNVCDLKLTSLTHATQHYEGRKHKLVVKNVSKPKGAGFYDPEGKWVRTGTKSVVNDGRFGIGDNFKAQTNAVAGSTKADATGAVRAVAPTAASNNITVVEPKQPLNQLLHCNLCNISVTSLVQMAMHLEGSKHNKKVKLSGSESMVVTETHINASGESKLANVTNSILASIGQISNADLSMYRTPTGSYYCKTCNMTMCHISGLQQHLNGKKHMKKLIEDKIKPTSPSSAVETSKSKTEPN